MEKTYDLKNVHSKKIEQKNPYKHVELLMLKYSMQCHVFSWTEI